MSAVELRVPQWRVLRALVGGGALSRAALGERAGYTAVSGTVTRALNGVKEGSSSGPAHAGLLALGYVREIVLDIDGEKETCYRLTNAGREALECHDGEPPPARDKSTCINHRYKETR